MTSAFTGIGRRKLLNAGATATLGLMMTHAASAGPANAAEHVADTTSPLKITAVRGFSVAGKIYIKIETHRQITG